MHETTHGFFHLDHPPHDTPVPAGPVVLRGWVAGPAGRPFVDLRLRLGGDLHPAVLGLPRADLAAFFKLRDAFLPGGFEATIDLPPGEQAVAFEALDISGRWQEIGAVRLTAGASAPAAVAPARPEVQPHEFARALLGVLRRAAGMPVTQAAGAEAAGLPFPAVLRYPPAPFHGHLHQPALLERLLFGRLRLEGWLFHETAAVRRVTATVDLQAWQELNHGGPVPYVAALFPQSAAAQDCALSGLIDVPGQLPGPLCVRLYAELADGSWHLCHVQRLQGWTQEQEKAPFAAFSRRTFLQAVLALRRACAARGAAVPWSRPWLRALRSAYRDYRARARRPSFVARPPRAGGAVGALRRVTFVTHNLDREGAPLFLLELGRHLVANGAHLQVISARDGPLAAQYAALGATVRVVDVAGLAAATSAAALRRAINRLAATVPLDGTDLVVANTLSACWGVHLAHRAGRPSLFYIHESTTPAGFYLGHLAPAVLPVIEETFRLATHVSFLTETTRVYYRPWLGADNHSINPGWIDVRAIDNYLATHPRDRLRRDLGVAPAERLVVNLGTVCDRKGQHIFARAVDLFWRSSPALAASCRFVMVGGHATSYDADLQRLLGQLDRPNLQVVPATGAPLAWYGAADLFVCSSYEESFPRVIMEAMACRVPILSTDVHGIRDMLTSGRDSWLVPAGDSHALAGGLEHLLSHPTIARDHAERARPRVTGALSAEILLPRHAALAARVAARPA